MKKKVEMTWDNSGGFFVRDAFYTLRTNVLFCGREVKAIVITSCLENEGKSTVSIGLAKGLAENGERVLFLDADLRKSVLASRVKTEGTIVGLSQVLSGQIQAEEVIYETDCKGLDVVFAGPFPPNPAELLTGKEFKEFVASLRENYDHIIIDAAPLGLVVDAAAIAEVCDGSILVLNKGQIKSRLAQNVKKQLERSKCQILGAVLNQTTRRNRRSSYGYYYYQRYSSYGKYYGKYGYGRYGAYGKYESKPEATKEQKK